MMNLNNLRDQVFEIAEARGLWEGKTTGDALIALNEETRELWDAFNGNKRTGKGQAALGHLFEGADFIEHFENNIKNTLEDELADIILISLSIAGKLKIDIEAHADLKMRYNVVRDRPEI